MSHFGFDPRPVLARLTIPILWQWGAVDRSVFTPESADELALLRPGHDYTGILYPGGAHSLLVTRNGLDARSAARPATCPGCSPTRPPGWPRAASPRSASLQRRRASADDRSVVARPLTLGQTLAVFAGLAAAVFAVLLMAVAATSGGSGDAAQAAPAAPAPVAVPTGPPGAGPAVGSVFVSSQPPSLPDGGPNGAAIWLRDTTRLPAAPIALFAAAGIPARIVTSALDAFAHPLVLSWPSSALSTEELRLLAAYGAAGGTLLAVEPDVRTQQVLGYSRGAVFARLALVPETGASGGALRDMQVAALRR